MRLEGRGLRSTNYQLTSFNSLLVRLEGNAARRFSSCISVSIPYWCDWKDSWVAKLIEWWMFQFLIGAIGSVLIPHRLQDDCMFQFLIGAIGSNITRLNGYGESSFNSLLVRLEDGGLILSFCDSPLFQFLIGAIGRR